ncbi:pPIWI_RE module domain-containing protein [Streptomyces harbinensis]
MGFTYQRIRTAAYLPDPAAAPLRVGYRAMPFPEEWRAGLLELSTLHRAQDAAPHHSVPTYRLDGVLQTLAPELIVRPRPAQGTPGGADYWLYAPMDSPDPLPGPAFSGLLSVWAHSLRPEPQYADRLRHVRDELLARPPAWQQVEADLLSCPHTDPGKTAVPEDRQYHLATDWLARRIAALEPYDSGAGALHFRAIPRGPRQKGAELVSQPLPHEAGGHVWWYSVLITITLHTVPFDPLPRLHLATGIRRWATRTGKSGRLYLPPGRATSVHLLPRIPWLPGAPASSRYAIARLGWDRESRSHTWRAGDSAGLLRTLTLSQPFPDPEQLLTSPEEWIGESTGVRAAVVHRDDMGKHGVGKGLMPHQRSQLTAWAEQALPEGLRPAPEPRRSTLAPGAPLNRRTKTTKTNRESVEAEEAQARRAELAAVQDALLRHRGLVPEPGRPPVCELRLLWQSASMRQEAIAALVWGLGLKGDGGTPEEAQAPARAFDDARPGDPVILEWETPEVTVRLRCLPLVGGLAEDLAIDTEVRPRRQAVSDAVHDRRTAVAAALARDGADPGHPTLALVEIDFDVFASDLHDPKHALRLGCADAGAVTQFVRVPRKAKGYNTEKDVTHRARQGWLDGMRQMGVRVLPEHSVGELLPAGLRYAALWMVKRRKDGPTRLAGTVPVAIRLTPGSAGGAARVEGWNDKGHCWVPYPMFLIGLVKEAEITDSDVAALIPRQRAEDGTESGTDRGDQQTEPLWPSPRKAEEYRKRAEHFVQRVLRSLRDTPTLLFGHAQNTRGHWTWLQNGTAEPDRIGTGTVPAPRPHATLRLIRVRDAAGYETPQWWGTGAPDGINGIASGLWTGPENSRVFHSTTEKPAQFTASAVEADKLAPRRFKQGPRKGELTIDTDKPAWTPALLELTVLSCHPEAGDRPEALALAAHQLRQAPDYGASLALPLPLHLARLAEEYVLPTSARGDLDTEENDASPAAEPEGFDGQETLQLW